MRPPCILPSRKEMGDLYKVSREYHIMPKTQDEGNQAKLYKGNTGIFKNITGLERWLSH